METVFTLLPLPLEGLLPGLAFFAADGISVSESESNTIRFVFNDVSYKYENMYKLFTQRN